MKRLNFFEKIFLMINGVFALLLLISYLNVYIDPEAFAYLSFLSIIYPFLCLINLVFCLVWMIKLKLHFLISLLAILCGFAHINRFISLKQHTPQKHDRSTKLMSYNVRQFNKYKWIKSNTLKQDISNFIQTEKPDIIGFQEYVTKNPINIHLPYQYTHKKYSSGLAIFSKTKIYNSGYIDFEKTSNNIIYVDVKINHKLTRVYNVHLQSFHINMKDDYLNKNKLQKLYLFMMSIFKKQSHQIKTLKKHIEKCPYPSIVMGDFNSTAFSWNYKQFIPQFKDAFVEKGTGIGKSFRFPFPLRIDYFFVDKSIEITNYKTYPINL